MKIAICDDEPYYVNRLRSLIAELDNSKPEVFVFIRGEDLLGSRISFDILFLDIEMPNLGGFQVAQRMMFLQPDCILLFVTSHDELAVDGYKFRAFRYLKKSEPQSVRNGIKEAIAEYNCRRKTLEVMRDDMRAVVNLSDILYIEALDHTVQIYAKHGVYFLNRKMIEIEAELRPYGLVRCHKSFMVNLRLVEGKTKNEFFLLNGTRVSIGRKYRDEMEQVYTDYKVNGGF